MMQQFISGGDPLGPASTSPAVPAPPKGGSKRPFTASCVNTRQWNASAKPQFEAYSAEQRQVLEHALSASTGATKRSHQQQTPPSSASGSDRGQVASSSTNGESAAPLQRFQRLQSAPHRRPVAPSDGVAVTNGLQDALADMHMIDKNPIYWKAWHRGYNDAPNVGPGSYDPGEAKDALRKHSYRAGVPKAPRLGMVLKSENEVEADVTKAEKMIRTTRNGGRLYTAAPLFVKKHKSKAKAANRSGTQTPREAASSIAVEGDAQDLGEETNSAPRRPHTARTKYVLGGGHWCDGMATGTSIVGCYNRYRQVGPGTGKYNVTSAAEFVRPKTQRCSFGTSARFPGEKPLPSPRGDSPRSRPASARAPATKKQS